MSPIVAPTLALTLDEVRRLHVLNIGGTGMSAIATLLVESGHTVSGHDDNDTPYVDRLRSIGVAVAVGEPGELADAVDAIVVSTATDDGHPHLVEADRRGVPVVHRAALLERLCATRTVTAVSGTHGKTTTTAMIATINDHVGNGAGFLVASTVTGMGVNAAWRDGPGLAVEADESDGTFLRCNADLAVVTNVESDHMSYWKTEAALRDAFGRFVSGAPSGAVICIDDAGAAPLAALAVHAITYGTDPKADFSISDIRPAGLGVAFELAHGHERVTVTVPMAPGEHNARNAAAAIAATHQYGVSMADAAAGLATFAGVARRFERMGEVDGITFIDSYDHLPTEVAAALAAAAAAPFDRVVCVFQPHRYTRTRDLWQTFGDCFDNADVLAICGLYTAGEAPIEGVSGRLIVDAVTNARPDRDVHWLPDLDAVHDWLVAELRSGDMCLTLNAGDLRTVPSRVISTLESR